MAGHNKIHASEHTNGTDDIQSATAGQKGLMAAADKSKLDGVAANANNYSHPNHTGDVTSTGDGATVIANGAVTNAKAADMAQATIKGRQSGAGTGDPEDLTAAQARTILNVADGADVTANNPPQAHALVGSLHTVPAPPTVTPDATPGTTDIDWSNGPIQLVDLVNATGTETLTFSNLLQGHTYRLFFKQHPTTPQNVTLPSTVKIAGGTAPSTLSLSAGAAAIDLLTMVYDGTNLYVESFTQNHG